MCRRRLKDVPCEKSRSFSLEEPGVLSYNDEWDQDISTLKCPEKRSGVRLRREAGAAAIHVWHKLRRKRENCGPERRVSGMEDSRVNPL